MTDLEKKVEKLEKEVLMLNIGMAIVMRILKQKGLVSLDQLLSEAGNLSQGGKKQEGDGSDKEAGYNKILQDFEVDKDDKLN